MEPSRSSGDEEIATSSSSRAQVSESPRQLATSEFEGWWCSFLCIENFPNLLAWPFLWCSHLGRRDSTTKKDNISLHYDVSINSIFTS